MMIIGLGVPFIIQEVLTLANDIVKTSGKHLFLRELNFGIKT